MRAVGIFRIRQRVRGVRGGGERGAEERAARTFAPRVRAGIGRDVRRPRRGSLGERLGFETQARAALGEGPQIKFAVCCGALMPTKGPYADLFERLRATDAALTVPTLHCLSKSSSVCEESEQLAECFGPSARLLWHDNGDALPSSSWWEETQGFPEKSIGGNRWVTQYAGPFYYPDRMTRMRSS